LISKTPRACLLIPKAAQQHVVEILKVVDLGTSIVLAAHVHANFHAQTVLQAMAQVLLQHGKPDSIPLDRDTRWVGSASGRDFPSAFLRFLLCLKIAPNVCPPHRPDLNSTLYISHWEAKRSALLKSLALVFCRTHKARQRMLSSLMSEGVKFSGIIETQ
jgi:hypothetical protein